MPRSASRGGGARCVLVRSALCGWLWPSNVARSTDGILPRGSASGTLLSTVYRLYRGVAGVARAVRAAKESKKHAKRYGAARSRGCALK